MPILSGPKVPGATLVPLAKADHEALRAALTNDLPGFEHDRYSSLARALFTTGAALHVGKDVHVEEPFTLRYEGCPGALFARNVLVLEAGAKATVLLESTGMKDAAKDATKGESPSAGVLGLTAEVLLGPGAELRLLGVETTPDGHTTLLTTQARTGEGATLDVHHAFTGGSLVKTRSDVILQGRGSRVHQSEVVFGHGQQRFDLTSNIAHAGPETTSDALSKAALKDASRANLKGVILLPQTGKDSDSYLQQHAMLLSKQARCIAIPSLEIVNREIKRAKHAATVAQIDEGQVFYLQTRGLPETEARKLIVMGFLGPLLQRLGEGTAERLRGQIEASWG
jgi:Fe-S cluster assembly scaffold protein SufB